MATAPVALVADNLYQVQLPLPFALRIVNCYLLRAPDGWAVIDTGLHTADGEAAWLSAFDQLGLRPGDLQQIVVTHHHPDHYGMAGWLLAWNQQPAMLYTTARERQMIEAVWWPENNHLQPFSTLMRQAGVGEPMLADMLQVTAEIRARTMPQATEFTLIGEGDILELCERTFQVYIGPGHTVAQALLYDAQDRLMLCADHVLLKITPNIGLWPGSDSNPLEQFLASLQSLMTLDVRLALPGHKALILDWRGRISELVHHHETRLAHMAEAAAPGATALDVAQSVFNFDQFTAHEMRFAIAETLAHLEYLRSRGSLGRSDEQPWRYYSP
jgi:glyoxylase-like metal-dependent hydrolase (beta-lactamase superfamily II)